MDRAQGVEEWKKHTSNGRDNGDRIKRCPHVTVMVLS